MELSLFILASLFLASASASPVTTSPILPGTASTDIEIAASQLDQASLLAISISKEALQNGSSGTCTESNIAIRREWGALSTTERKEYIAAVQCLQALPAKTPSELIPGAKSRYDDFVGTHINQTTSIHFVGIFLQWHRQFLWEYEQALRNECSYTGYQPYWNWGLSAQQGIENSPIFDGSDTSLSGNGEVVLNQTEVKTGGTMGLPIVMLPPGTGGGCVTGGPFKNMSVNLGPISLSNGDGTTSGSFDTRFDYNPRCLKRDLSQNVNQRYANMSTIASLILDSTDMAQFQLNMEGSWPESADFGVHAGGHFSIGGDPGRDIFSSPGDPAFYLHHGMVDRVWWTWQQLDLPARGNALWGTETFLNTPPSANTTLDAIVNTGFAGGDPVRIGDLMSTTGGPLCYRYE